MPPILTNASDLFYEKWTLCWLANPNPGDVEKLKQMKLDKLEFHTKLISSDGEFEFHDMWINL